MLTKLFAHMNWANLRVIEALQAADRPDPKVVELLAHVLAAEHLWHARILGVTPSYPVWPRMSLDECTRLARENHERFTALVASLKDGGADRDVTYTNTAGVTYSSTVSEILTHVALHGSYHRGQIAWQMRADGQTPNVTDLIVFTRGGATPR